MKKLNKCYLILIILILYSFIQFFEWFKYSTLISNFINKKNVITKNEIKKNNLVNVLKKKNKISIEKYEKRFGEIFEYLPNKNEELGYITDYSDQKDVGLEYMLTQYSLSPYIIKLSLDKKYLIGNFSKEIIEDNIIENNRYIFCEEKERKRNFDEIINYTKTNNKIKNTWPKNKIMIYSPFLKRSGNKLKQYKCVKNKNFKIVKKFDNGVMLIQRD